MEWLLILVGAAGVWAFFNANLLWLSKGRKDLEHAIRSLLVLMEDGGWLSIRERGSSVKLRVIRENSTDSGATLRVCVPRDSWSSAASHELHELSETHGYRAVFGHDPAGDPLCDFRVVIDDIWVPWAGASGARLVNLVLDALRVQADARFKLALVGRRSRRLVDRERALRRGDQGVPRDVGRSPARHSGDGPAARGD